MVIWKGMSGNHFAEKSAFQRRLEEGKGVSRAVWGRAFPAEGTAGGKAPVREHRRKPLCWKGMSEGTGEVPPERQQRAHFEGLVSQCKGLFHSEWNAKDQRILTEEWYYLTSHFFLTFIMNIFKHAKISKELYGDFCFLKKSLWQLCWLKGSRAEGGRPVSRRLLQ